MIFRLEYKNKALKTARVDIITPTGTGVETVEGTGYPFRLKYEGDKKNKGLMFLSSSAEINIYETPLFNIDTLKTSGEKDIRVNYYIDSVLEWTGFVIPDFFSREIGGDGVVSMVASDRLAVLDSEVLEGLPVTVTLRTLLSLSLAKTGLILPLKTVVDFATVSGNTAALLNHSIRSQRLTDTKGRSVNCKDIIKSILVATNSKLMQRKGAWWVINKMQHELGGGRVYTSPTAFTNYVEDLISFTDVTRGAMRTIAPVAGGVGVFQEYGGGKLIPDNYNFKNGLTGWTGYNGFVSSTNNRRVLGYTQSGDVYTPIYDDAGTSEPYLVNRNISPLWVLFQPSRLGSIPDLWDPYAIKSTRIISPVVSSDSTSVKVAVEINAVGINGTYLPFSIVLKRPGRENLLLNRNSEWQTRAIAHLLSFKNEGADNLAAVSAGMSVSAVISAESSGEVLDDVGTYTIEVLIFGSGLQGGNIALDTTTLINSASVQFSAASNDTPKGTLYKADQGGESYTKIHDTETTVFGDYLTGGLNGYFYNYAPDDTSSLLAPNGSRSQPAWVNTYTQNTEPLPLLQQTIRQMRRMFSVAHDFIKGEIDVSDFDPLSIFEDCERRFVIVEAEFDFLRGSLQVVLEEVAYQNLTVREYIYSYFGEGDEGIRGISGISAGSSGGGGGGGMAPEPSWLENEITIDPESGLLSVDGWHVKGDLIIEGQVNQWLAQQLVVDDARIQVNRKQGGAVADSGLVIFDKDTSAEVSSLVYDVNGIWRAGGQRIFTDDYNPKLGGVPAADYALKSWIENSATAYNAARLGGYSAASYPRKAEDASITGAWTFGGIGGGAPDNYELNVRHGYSADAINRSASIIMGRSTEFQLWKMMSRSNLAYGNGPDFLIQSQGGTGSEWEDIIIAKQNGNVGFGVDPTERLHVAGNGLFTGNLTAQGNLSAVDAALSGTLDVTGTSTLTGAVTAGGNVGTSNFVSQMKGWRVTPQGQADFRHIFTDELQAKAFTADISQALVGSDVLTKSVAKLAQNFTVTTNGTTAPLYVEELEGFAGLQVFAVNDILLIRIFDRSGGGLLIKNVWVEVASYVGTTDNVQQFTVNVINSGGVAGLMAYAGSMILDYGQSGSGLIQRTVLDQQGSPYSRVTTWENNPWTPGNYTLHYQSGNLNGLANAEGWGVYSQNSFLTGKLLVGDLTKAGQYMEYENGQLTLKGSITVTGGNAATKADVDAVQVGGRNLLLGTKDFTGWNNNSTVEDSTLFSGLKMAQAKGSYTASVNLLLDYGWNFKIGEVYTISVWARTDTPGSTIKPITGITNVPSEKIVTSEWVRYSWVYTSNYDQLSRFRFETQSESNVVYITAPKVELGNRATDWTPAPEDVDAKIADTKLYVEYSTDGTSWHTTFQANDVYMRQKTGVNGTWTGAIKIVGKDGTSVSIEGKVPTSASLPGSASLGDGYIAEDTGHLWVWTGSWTDAGQIRGDNGANSFIHIAYADDSQGGGFSHNPAGKSWIGTYADFTAIDSDTPSDYTWMYAKGQQGDPGISVSGTDVEFAQSTSATIAPTTGWQTTAPEWIDGQYIWTRTKTTYSSGNPTYSAAVNLTGAKGGTGSTGAAGTGVSSITEQYYLSTSKTTQTGGSWVESPPAWEAGKYMWTRVQIVYENPTSTDYTDPIVSAEWDAIDTLKDRVENTLGLADLENINETLITGNKVRTSLLEVTDIVAQGITAGHVEGLTLNFTKGEIGSLNIESGAVGHNADNNKFIGMVSQTGSNATIGGGDSYLRRGFGMYHYDSATVPGGFKLMRMGMLSNSDSSNTFPSTPEYGFQIRLAATTNDVFRVDNTGAFIAGITFDDSKLSTQNWELRKDGSFRFGAGGEIEGGLITGVIESSNWDGAEGSRLNLLDGSLEFGNTIKVDSFSKEIIVKDGDTQNTGVRIGDFLLSPTTGGAGALDVDLSGSRVVSPESGYSLSDSLTGINSSGALGFGNVNVSTNLSAGNGYTFQTGIKVRMVSHNVQTSVVDRNPQLTPKNSLSQGSVKPMITVSLFSGATKVGEQIFIISGEPDLGDVTFFDKSLNISIPFTADSNSLRVEISQSGELIWKAQRSDEGPIGGDFIDFMNVRLTYSELNTSSRVRIVPSAAINELSAKGFLSLWGPEKYFRIYDRAGVTNFIEARGTQVFISPNGNYRLRISDTGIQKSVNGGSWTSL